MLTIINVGEKPILDSELMRHLPLRYGQSVKADDKRISEETRRTRCSRVSTNIFFFFLNSNYIDFLYYYLLLLLEQVVFCILDHLQRWLRERRLLQDSRYKAIKSV